MKLTGLRPFAIALAGAALIFGACTTDDGDGGGEAASTPTPISTEIVQVEDSRDPAGGGIEPANPESPPGGTLASAGGEVVLGLGSYCWSPPTGSGAPAICADAIGVITAPADLAATAGETLTIEGEQGSLPWPPMTIEGAHLWPAPDEPVDSQPDFRAWQPQGDAQALATDSSTIGAHTVTLPDDLAPGRYVLAVNYTAGPDRGSDAMYGALLVVE